MDPAKLDHCLSVFIKHQQHYPNSCIASAVEIILKVEGRVDSSFRALQDLYQDDSKDIHFAYTEEFKRDYGISFSAANLDAKDESKLCAILDDELNSSRFPLISLFGDNPDPKARNAKGHMHIVAQSIAQDYVALSKAGILTTGQLVRQSTRLLKAVNLYLYSDC